MLKLYCSECGTPTEYSLNKPKFCSNCGNSFFGNKREEKVVQKTLLQKPTLKAKRQNVEPQDIDDDDYEITEVNQMPDIEGLDFDIHVQPDHKETIGNIVGTSKEKENSLRKNRIADQISKEQQLEIFKKEAGAIRPKR